MEQSQTFTNNGILDIKAETDLVTEKYKNFQAATINDHVIRVSVMTEDFYWHYHPDSDETFLVMEGELFIDLEDRTVELKPGQLFSVPKNMPHRTRAKTQRTVSITFERDNIQTVKI